MIIERVCLLRAMLIVMLLSCFVVSCSRSPAVRFYTLSPTAVAATKSGNELAVFIARAEFPRSLARKQIVTRAGTTQLAVDQFNVWSAPLETEFLRVLGDNIATRLDIDRVVSYPAAAPFKIDYTVRLDVAQFDGVRGQDLILRVRWSILDADKSAAAVGTFNNTQVIAADDDDYDTLVAAHSTAIGILSDAIAAELLRLSGE